MLSIGIVGLPNVGKSTLFNALTDNNILAANYPFATIEPNVGIVPVPDTRLRKLSDIFNGAPIKPATVTFVDIAGLVSGASKGEGLGNQFLANIRSCNAICHVVRAFSDTDVQHVDSTHDPKNDIAVINTELILTDLQSVEKRLPVIQKEAKVNIKLKPEADALLEVKKLLDDGRLLIDEKRNMKKEFWGWLQKELQLLTMKPVVYLFNIDEQTLVDETKKQELAALVTPALSVFVSAKLESELRGLDESDRQELLESYNQNESGLNQLSHAAYNILGLRSYLTAGEKEVRAWTIKQGMTAPQAAGVIHGDFERGFIAAEIVNYDDLVASGSLSQAKSAGKVRTEGKSYIVNEGDIIEFKFNI